MPHTLHWENEGLVTVFEGVCTAAEFYRATLEFSSDSRAECARYFIWVLHDATLCDSATYGDLVTELQHDRSVALERPHVYGAFVGATGRLQDFNDLYVQASTELGMPWQLASFDSLSEAYGWLRLAA